MAGETETEDGSKRVTVLFNARHVKAIEREVARRTKKRGYAVTLSDALRELVEEQWVPK